MVDAHGAVMRSCADATIEVKRAMALASRPYDDDGPRWRDIGGPMVGLAMGELEARQRTMAMVAMATRNVASLGLNSYNGRLRR